MSRWPRPRARVVASAGRLETWELRSRFVDPRRIVFNEPPEGAAPRPPALRVNVLRPEAFDPSRRYPVLYLLHGRSDAYDHWADPGSGAVADLVAGLDAFVVMPEGARGWYTDWWNDGRRAEPAWERHHLEELLPLVERRLPLRPGRRWRAIAGLSMGGLGALTYAARRPDYFGSAASFSGALSIRRADWPPLLDTETEHHRAIYGDPHEQSFYWEAHDPPALLHNLRATRLYVTAGDAPGTESAVRAQSEDLVAAARGAGLDVTWEPKGGSHEWPTWQRALSAALRWGPFEPVVERPDSWAYRTVARRGLAWDVRFRFDSPPDRVQRFERESSALRGVGSGRVTLSGPRGVKGRHVLPFELAL